MKLKTLSDQKDALAALQSIAGIATSLATLVALIIGCAWFIQQEDYKPRLKLEQTVRAFQYDNNLHRKLLIVDARVENSGHVPVRINCASVHIAQIVPDYKNELGAKGNECNVDLGQVTIEPAEAQQIYHEFYIPDNISAIRVATFIPLPERPRAGWWVVTTQELPLPQPHVPRRHRRTG